MRKQRKPKPPVESEASIQRRIKEYLEAHGWFVFENRSGYGGKIAGFVTPQQAGSPDLFVWGVQRGKRGGPTPESIPVIIPRHFAVEVKRPGGKQSPAQIAWCGRYCATGHSYVLAYDHTCVERFLKGKGWE